MDLSSYADLAVRLVNTDQPERGTDALSTVEAIRALLPPDGRGERLADESDLPRLRAVRIRLRAVFTSAAEGDQPRAVALLNELLAEYPVSAVVTAHSGVPADERWHLHLADNSPTATAICAGTAAAGLAAHLTRYGATRLGVCAAEPCRNAFLDTSTNRSRRYCSDRCATRRNVAAHRARRRA